MSLHKPVPPTDATPLYKKREPIYPKLVSGKFRSAKFLFMGLALAIHLGIVYAFFLVLPFSKFVHAIYRFAALLADAGEVRRSAV